MSNKPVSTRVLFTCEHGGNRVPNQYASLFRGQRRVLESHRGYDHGALPLAQSLSRQLDAPLIQSTVTRLLIDLNRSLGHRAVFSQFTRQLDKTVKESIIDSFYWPYRDRVEQFVGRAITQFGSLVHVSVHSFTPVFHGKRRKVDIGLLYDPSRDPERQFCAQWGSLIQAACPDLSVRRNHPYLGKADGLTTSLRRRFSEMTYLGIELEVRSDWIEDARTWRRLKRTIATALAAALAANIAG